MQQAAQKTCAATKRNGTAGHGGERDPARQGDPSEAMKSKKQKRPPRTATPSPPSGKAPAPEVICAIGPTVWRNTGDRLPEIAQALAAFMADAQSVAQSDPKRFAENYHPRLCILADILAADSPGYLCMLAEMGNPAAIRQLAKVAIRTTECLERVVKNQAEVLAAIGAERRTWPLMVSARAFENRHFPEVLKKLKLGGPKPGSKFKFDTPIVRYTEELRQHFSRMHGFIRNMLEVYAAESVKPPAVSAILEEHVGIGGLITAGEIPVFEESWTLEEELRRNPQPSTEWRWAKLFTRWAELKHGSLAAFWKEMKWRPRKGDTRLQGKTEEKFAEALEKLGPPVK